MDDNVMRVLQLLQDGKISAQEAETLIASLSGETVSPSEPTVDIKKDADNEDDKSVFDRARIGIGGLGERISQAVSKIQPDKIAKRVQSQLRTATQAGAHWSSTVSSKVRTWTEGDDTRPENKNGLPEQTESQEQEFHLEAGAFVSVENPLGSVKITGTDGNTATVVVRKSVWAIRNEDLGGLMGKVDVSLHGTDSRLDVKASAADFFREGTVDLELRVPKNVKVRVASRFGMAEIVNVEGLAEGVTTTGSLHFTDLANDARGETATGDIVLARIGGSAAVATQSGNISATEIQRGLSANAASGDVSASKVEGGRVECKSVSGDVSVKEVGVSAPLDITVESVSGDASLENASGNIAIKAVSGEAQAINIAATRLQVQTVSGNVMAQLREPFSGAMQINTVSGDVTLQLPEGSNVRVSLSTMSGELRCEHDAHDVSAAETIWSGEIGTGAGTLNVQTISGDAHILRTAQDTPNLHKTEEA